MNAVGIRLGSVRRTQKMTGILRRYKMSGGIFAGLGCEEDVSEAQGAGEANERTTTGTVLPR